MKGIENSFSNNLYAVILFVLQRNLDRPDRGQISIKSFVFNIQWNVLSPLGKFPNFIKRIFNSRHRDK